MRHLQLVVDHTPAPTDFPPTWHEFEAARERFFAGLEAPAAPAAGDAAAAQATPPGEVVPT
jgi:hypothetical protein